MPTTAMWPRTSASGSSLRHSWPPSSRSARSVVAGARSTSGASAWNPPTSHRNGSPMRVRMPTAVAARATTSGSRAVPDSRKQVVPLRIISRHARRVPACSSSSVTVFQ